MRWICTVLGPRGPEAPSGSGSWSVASQAQLPSGACRSLASFQRSTKLCCTSVADGPATST
jgi:hypothetical protein